MEHAVGSDTRLPDREEGTYGALRHRVHYSSVARSVSVCTKEGAAGRVAWEQDGEGPRSVSVPRSITLARLDLPANRSGPVRSRWLLPS